MPIRPEASKTTAGAIPFDLRSTLAITIAPAPAPAHGAGPKPYDNLKKAIGILPP
jgi:hypothetical protein